MSEYLTPAQIENWLAFVEREESGPSDEAATLREYAAIVEAVATGEIRSRAMRSDGKTFVYLVAPFIPESIYFRAREVRGYE